MANAGIYSRVAEALGVPLDAVEAVETNGQDSTGAIVARVQALEVPGHPSWRKANGVQDTAGAVLGWLEVDQDPLDFWDADGQGELKEFISQAQVDAFLAEGWEADGVKLTHEDGRVGYLIDRYEHGGVHYSVADTRQYPDQRWDVARKCGVYFPDKEMLGGWAAEADVLDDANRLLAEYSRWRNGEVYVVRCETFAVEAGVVEAQEYDSCGGIVGQGAAWTQRDSIMRAASKHLAREAGAVTRERYLENRVGIDFAEIRLHGQAGQARGWAFPKSIAEMLVKDRVLGRAYAGFSALEIAGEWRSLDARVLDAVWHPPEIEAQAAANAAEAGL